MSLTQPAVGSVGWGPAVNLNFQSLQDFCNNVGGVLTAVVPDLIGDAGLGGVRGLAPAPAAGDAAAGKFL